MSEADTAHSLVEPTAREKTRETCSPMNKSYVLIVLNKNGIFEL